MNGVGLLYDLGDLSLVARVVVQDGKAKVIEGKVPADVLNRAVLTPSGALTPANGETWLQEWIERFSGQLAGVYQVEMDRHHGPGPHKGTKTPQTVHGKKGPRDRDEVHQALAEGDIDNLQSLIPPMGVSSVNQRFLWTADVGGVPAVIKTAAVDKEFASHEANEMMGRLVDMPVTVERRAPHGSRAAYIEWLDGEPAMGLKHTATEEQKAEWRKTLSKQGREQLSDMDVFDAVIGNFDRSRANFLVDGSSIHPIDHGRSWQDFEVLPSWVGNTIWGEDRTLKPRHRQALSDFKAALRDDRGRLGRYVAEPNLDLAVRRANWMLENGMIWRNDPLDGTGAEL